MNTNPTSRTVAVAIAVGLLAAAGGYGVATWRQQGGAATQAAAGAALPAASAVAGRQVLYWYDPMKPEARFDKPGRSPFMDMDLVPRYADEAAAAGAGGVAINARLTQSLGMRLATVTRESINSGVEATGTLGFNERDVAIVQTRTAGFVEKVYARAPGDVVAAGAPLVDVLVPEWAGAQREFLAVRATGDTALTAAVRQRLLLLGMGEALVTAIERSGQPRPVMTLTSPIGGVIQELMVRQGMALAPMMTLARINGLSTLWLEAAVPEVHAALLAVGRPVQARFAAYPGEVFSGRIAAVLPEANRETRTLRVRIELPNKGGKLRAGMYAQATLAGAAESALVVPSEAVIRTGRRALVFVAGGEGGRYTPVDVELGREVGGRLVILKGLSEGQQVVASGQFLVDSEASVTGVIGRTAAAPVAVASAATTPAVSTAPALHQTLGVVRALAADEIELDHEPVPALKWPAMTMPFALKSPALLQGLTVGDRVRFGFRQGPSGVVIEQIEKLAAAAAASASTATMPGMRK